MLIISGYSGSVIAPVLWLTKSTSSFSAARFTSFHFKSLSGSAAKSNTTAHCRSFWTSNSSRASGDDASAKETHTHTRTQKADAYLNSTYAVKQRFCKLSGNTILDLMALNCIVHVDIENAARSHFKQISQSLILTYVRCQCHQCTNVHAVPITKLTVMIKYPSRGD